TPEGLKMVKQQPMNKKRQRSNYQQPPQQPASRHRAGHQAGLHPEEAPDEEDRDGGDYVTRPPRSAIRHRPIEDEGIETKGVRVAHHYHDQPVMQRRSRQQAPPTRQHYDASEEKRPARGRVSVRPNVLVFVGVGLLLLI